jgi:hypothetical protein
MKPNTCQMSRTGRDICPGCVRGPGTVRDPPIQEL